jgi:hypothetical protein
MASRGSSSNSQARVRELLLARQQVQDAAAQAVEDRRKERLEVVLQLKADTAAAAEVIRGKNASLARRRLVLEEAHKQEHDELLQQGKNPYVVFKQRQVEEDAHKAEARQRRLIREKEQVLAERLAAEEIDRRKRMEKEAEARAYETAYRRSLGRHVTEERNAAYLKSKTTTGTDIIDPTGKLHRVQPSQVTCIKDAAFGMGYARHPRKSPEAARQVVEMVKAKTLRSAAPGDGDESSLSAPVANIASSPVKTPRRPKSPSKFEKDSLRAAQRRQRERLDGGVAQKVGAWVYPAGKSGFVAEPCSFSFIDFELGKKYRKRVVLTNGSLAANRFDVLPLPSEFLDLFDVTYTRHGRMSAGMSCPVEVQFKPRSDEDVDTELSVRTETGPLTVPITCRKRRARPSIMQSSIDFEGVVRGEMEERWLEIRNDGILPIKYKVRRRPETDLDMSHPGEGNMPLEYATTGRVSSYSCSEHRIRFRPSVMGDFKEILEVVFSLDVDGQDEELTTEVVEISGVALDVPMSVVRDLIDLRCCVLGEMYIVNVSVRNQGKIAMKVLAPVPKELGGCASITPDMAFVQPGSDFSFSLKFIPARDLMENKSICEPREGGGLLRMTFPVPVPEQSIPVEWRLEALLTPGTLSLSERLLDFGDCYTCQGTTRVLTLRNEGLVPQRFGFVNTPPELSVSPWDGFGTLLPLESQDLDITLAPSTAESKELKLTLRTDRLCTYTVRAKGEGIDPPLSLNRNAVKMRAGEPVEESGLLLRNTSASPQTYSFVPPEGSGLVVSPSVGRLNAGETAGLMLTFDPPGERPTKGCIVSNWRILLFVDGCPIPLCLAVETARIPLPLEISPSVVEFGDLAVGQRRCLSVLVKKVAPEAEGVELHVSTPNVCGPFSVLNCARPPPHTIRVCFSPEQRGAFAETLQVTCKELGQELRVRMRGRGVSPMVAIEPNNGEIDMGHVPAGSSASRTISLRNNSDFEVSFQLEQRIEQCSSSGSASISVTPASGRIVAGGIMPLIATLSPLKPRPWPIYVGFRIKIPGIEVEPEFEVRGYGCASSLYVDPIPSATVIPPHERGVPEALLDDFDPRGDAEPPAVLVKFLKSGQQKCLRILGFEKAAGSFDIEIIPKDSPFKALPDKGTIAVGQSCEVSFAFESTTANSADTVVQAGHWERAVAVVRLCPGNNGGAQTSSANCDLEGYCE